MGCPRQFRATVNRALAPAPFSRPVMSRLAVPAGAISPKPGTVSGAQWNKLETDFSLEVREMASPMSGAMERTRILCDTRTASVGMIESVITSVFRAEAEMRATAPPESTPWVI